MSTNAIPIWDLDSRAFANESLLPISRGVDEQAYKITVGSYYSELPSLWFRDVVSGAYVISSEGTIVSQTDDVVSISHISDYNKIKVHRLIAEHVQNRIQHHPHRI